LGPKSYENDQKVSEAFKCDGLPSLLGFYYNWNFDDNESDQKRECLGLGDFGVYNCMLLFVLPPMSSMTTKICIVIGHIIAVQIGREATDRIAILSKNSTQPAVPLPVVTVSLYFIFLNTIIEY